MVMLEGVCFYHRVSQGVPFYHSSVVEELLTVGLYHRSRTLPGVTRFGGAPTFFKKRNRKSMAEKADPDLEKQQIGQPNKHRRGHTVFALQGQTGR